MAFHINSQNTKGGTMTYNVGNSAPDLGYMFPNIWWG